MSLDVATFGPSGYTGFPNGGMLEDRTGQAATLAEVRALCGAMPSSSLGWTSSAGQTPWMIGAVLGAFLAHGDAARFATGYNPPVVIEAPAYGVVATTPAEIPWASVVVRLGRRTSPSPKPRESPNPAPSAATELRAISGLQPAKLAELFCVSRTTFYKWMEGATPRDARFQHLVDVLAHAKDAQRKLPSSIDFSVWLRAPISAGGRTPFDLLREKRFSTFRGLIVRARSEELGLSLPAPATIASTLSREERAIARERISPSWQIDSEELDRKRREP